MRLTDEEMARRITRYEVAKRALIIFTAATVSVILGVLLSLSVGNKHRGVENRQILNTIQDCTQPTGKCYRDGQARTGNAVADINRVVILAAACAVGKTGSELAIQSQIQACVIRGLARDAATR